MGDTIFMIHGMWGGGWYWDTFQSFFQAKGYTCLTPDLRHHSIGPNDAPPKGLGRTSLTDYADDLEKQIRQLDSPPIIMGHSMGGLIAQILAARGLAKAAVLLTPAAPAGVLALRWSVLKTFWEVLLKPNFWNRPNKLSYETQVYATMGKLPEEERRYIYGRGVWESGRAATEIAFWLEGAKVDAKRVTCPLLVVAGREDRITPADVVRNVANRYPHATFMEFAGHAHWILREPGWEKPAGQISAWLEQTLGN